MKRIGRKLLALVALVGWSLAVGAGLERLWSYESAAGAMQQTLARWSGQSTHLRQVMNVVAAGDARGTPLTPVYGCGLR
jgi:hypothetical protein